MLKIKLKTTKFQKSSLKTSKNKVRGLKSTNFSSKLRNKSLNFNKLANGKNVLQKKFINKFNKFNNNNRFNNNNNIIKPINLNKISKKYLDLHEYQSKILMQKYNVRVQKGKVASTALEAKDIANNLLKEGAKELVVKAQIHAGGRGKGYFNTGFKGGVKVVTDAESVENMSKEMIGNNLITKQTPPDGQLCSKVLVLEGLDFTGIRELYYAIVLDRDHGGPVLIASKEGGMDIEEVAETNPDAIVTVPIDIKTGILPEHTAKISKTLGFEGKVATEAEKQMTNLYKLFIGSDSTQVEINPFVVTQDGRVWCVDAKINFDDNAAFRQKELFDQRDTSMEDPREVEASKAGLNYIGLDGNIGCMVNGAGLAMATMDIIKLYGGEPANFLDVGGGATEEQVSDAFRVITSDPKVKGVLVNIFGGIMKCDIIAQGIVNAAKNINLEVPLVVRLEGTNVDKGKQILKDSGLPIITADNLDNAAKAAVKAIKI